MVVFQKLEGKTTTLNFWNQKNGRKFYYSRKLCFDRIFEVKKMEGNSATPKNCVLTEFFHERSTIFLLVFSLIRFWILLRNVLYWIKKPMEKQTVITIFWSPSAQIDPQIFRLSAILIVLSTFWKTSQAYIKCSWLQGQP